jgi:plasmid maintenance system antidote protein VapI
MPRDGLLTEICADARRERPFGGSPEVWLGMQTDYDLAQAMKKADRIKVKPVPQRASA